MTDMADIDTLVSELRDAAPSWNAMGIDERIEIGRASCRERV